MNSIVDNVEKLAGPCPGFQLLRVLPQKSSTIAEREWNLGVTVIVRSVS